MLATLWSCVFAGIPYCVFCRAGSSYSPLRVNVSDSREDIVSHTHTHTQKQHTHTHTSRPQTDSPRNSHHIRVGRARLDVVAHIRRSVGAFYLLDFEHTYIGLDVVFCGCCSRTQMRRDGCLFFSLCPWLREQTN